jgi:hypothetical protein
VPHQLVHFFEGAFVEQQVDALARRKLALLVLALGALLTTACFSVCVAAAHFRKPVG